MRVAGSRSRASRPRASARSGARLGRSTATRSSPGGMLVSSAPASRRATPSRTRIRSDGPAGSSSAEAGGSAAARRASAVDTPTIGRSSALARAFAVASPTRRPVNAPGPVPTTMPTIDARSVPVRSRSARTIGSRSSPWRCPASQVSTATDEPSRSPRTTTAREVAVSSPSRRPLTGRRLRPPPARTARTADPLPRSRSCAAGRRHRRSARRGGRRAVLHPCARATPRASPRPPGGRR